MNLSLANLMSELSGKQVFFFLDFKKSNAPYSATSFQKGNPRFNLAGPFWVAEYGALAPYSASLSS